jgi:hypothetical protein
MQMRSAFGVGHGFILGTYKMSHAYMTAGQHSATIGILANELLLEVFDWYRQISVEQWNNSTVTWITLVHVCRRWRRVVFESPRRLDLWLLCTYGTPVRRALDCWPPLPIVIKYWTDSEFRPPFPEDEDNVLAALEHPDRVREIQLAVTSAQLEKVAERMQVRFPALTSLFLWLDQGTTPALSTAFLAGCAPPRLRDISLVDVTFHGLSGLAFTNDLVSLRLLEVPGAGYTAPGVVATCLSTLPHLRVLSIDSHIPPSESCCGPTPMTCDSLPDFQDASELDSLMARIDAPLLSQVNITFFNQPMFDTPLFFPGLSRFIGQTEVLLAKVADEESSPVLNGLAAMVVPLVSDQPYPGAAGNAALGITCQRAEQTCCQAPLLFNVENLDFRADYIRHDLKEDDVMDGDSVCWPPVEFLHSYSSSPPSGLVERLGSGDCVSELGPQRIAHASKGGGVDKETIRGSLPEPRMISALENLHPLNTLSLHADHQVEQRGVFQRAFSLEFPLTFPPVWDGTYM